MALLACVDVPCLSLQLLRKAHPGWEEHPAAVVSEDRPLGLVLEVSRSARDRGVQRGMRFSAALSLVPSLRAGTVSQEEISAGVEKIFRCLTGFSPQVETCSFEQGVYWLAAHGLGSLYSSLQDWTDRLVHELRERGFRIRCAVGHSRFGTFVGAKLSNGARFFSSPEEERRFSEEAPLSVLPFPPDSAVWFEKLGLATVSSFLRLSSGAIRLRFPPETEVLHRFASQDLTLPLQYRDLEEESVWERTFLYEITNSFSLGLEVDRLIRTCVETMNSELVRKLVITLFLEDGTQDVQEIMPAQATRDVKLLSMLSGLRLHTLDIGKGVTAVRLQRETIPRECPQIELFAEHPKRDLDAGARAFALIRAEVGQHAVQKAVSENEHLPEKRYAWKDITRPAYPRARIVCQADSEGSLVRRILELPLRLSWFKGDYSGNRYRSRGGPYRYSGYWWEMPIDREYRFIESVTGELLWVFRENGQWMVQGYIE